MAEQTKIQWADDTHNFWQGCTKVSDGCKNCYAEARDKRFTGGKLWGKGAPRQRSSSFNKPLAWNKNPWVCECGKSTCAVDSEIRCPHCNGDYHRRRVFSLSLGDIGDPEVDFQWFNDAMVIVEKCSNLDFLLLTKRPDKFLKRWLRCCEHWLRGSSVSLPPNVWIGTSVENQKTADERIPELLKIPAKVRFLSCEPLLGALDLTPYFFTIPNARLNAIHWVIGGGESGTNARPCSIEWIRSIKDQCKAAGVACFVKQLGREPFDSTRSPKEVIGWLNLKDKKGGDISEWPEDLRVREFPKHVETEAAIMAYRSYQIADAMLNARKEKV